MYYFAYGMNTNKSEMAMRCPKAGFMGPAKLHNHKFRFAGHADITQCDGEHVDGALWLITEQCLHELDLLEGYPRYYNRKTVTVDCGPTKFVAWTYYMNTGSLAMPIKYYWDCVLEGYMDHDISVDQLYRALDEVHQKNLTNNQDFDILRS